ncbi:hypothetical protein, partial [Sphingomonas sp.]|uniref:hypothetical protein n=1 Tax=Sphingomonas sp. TaxID=28214 RepID=UPI002D1921E8
MAASSYQSVSGRRRDPLGRRAIGLGLAIAVHVIGVLLVLLMPAPTFFKRPPPPERFEVQSIPADRIAPKPKPRGTVTRARQTAGGGAPPRTPAPTPPAPPAETTPEPTPPKMIVLSKDAFAAADIASLPPGAGAGASGSSSGKDSGAAYGPGEGPGGAPMYNAEWYVKPTDAQLAFYMPANRQPGWGEIACKTIENYGVENCRAL